VGLLLRRDDRELTWPQRRQIRELRLRGSLLLRLRLLLRALLLRLLLLLLRLLLLRREALPLRRVRPVAWRHGRLDRLLVHRALGRGRL
jgi:hypothetical protein